MASASKPFNLGPGIRRDERIFEGSKKKAAGANAGGPKMIE